MTTRPKPAHETIETMTTGTLVARKIKNKRIRAARIPHVSLDPREILYNSALVYLLTPNFLHENAAMAKDAICAMTYASI